tara:strand:- start:195 stop:629 length:435 start_codon:yes stop_codon:yes gene_type:complete
MIEINVNKAAGLCLLLKLVLLQSIGYAQSSNSIRDGIYTVAQAERGAEQYAARCASCHSADLRGNSNSPSLRGMAFMFIWEGKSVGELYTKMSAEMPTDQPGGLLANNYADILAFILQTNEFPSGNKELSPYEVDLNQIIISSN